LVDRSCFFRCRMYLFGGEKLPRRVLTQRGLVCSASNVHVVPLT
jgi:hypothetical protein